MNMKRASIAIILFIALAFKMSGQVYLPPDKIECATAVNLCHDTTQYFDDSGEGAQLLDRPGTSIGCNHNPFTLWYTFTVTSSQNINITVSSPDGISTFIMYGPFSGGIINACSQLASNAGVVILNHATFFTSHQFSLPNLAPGEYMIALHPSKCHSSVSFKLNHAEMVCHPVITVGCDNCIPALSLTPDKQYIVSCWVKEENAPATKTSYTTPQLIMEFPSAGAIHFTFGPSGQIIDGWQRIEGQFLVPNGATDFNIKLKVLAGNAFYDDIRIFPFDGVMTSYVFDPVSLRLVAQLDERNYATIYEYDKEGKLVRVKKETEKGIMTIQENRTSMQKK